MKSFENSAKLLIDFLQVLYYHFAAVFCILFHLLCGGKKKKLCENLLTFKKPEVVVKDRHLSPK